MFNDVKLLQLLKALLPMYDTFSEMFVTDTIPVQLWNAETPMLTTEVGIFTEVMVVQFLKALSPMAVIVSGIFSTTSSSP